MGLTVQRGRAAFVRQGLPLREAMMSVSRAIEDINWTNLSTDPSADYAGPGSVITYEDRKTLIKRARHMLRTNPLVKQGGNLLVNYVLGMGVSLTAANKTRVARMVDEFWDDPINVRTFTGLQAMSEFMLSVFTDGCVPLVLFPDKEEGGLQLGTIDALLLEDVITDPENWRIPKWYKVRKPRRDYDFNSGVYVPVSDDDFVFYRDWRNDDDAGGKDSPPAAKIADGLMYLAKWGKGKFGTSEVEAALDWVKAHKEFMEDRATITRAAATFAWKKKRKNSGAVDVATEVGRLSSTLAQAGTGYESNPPHAAGSMVVENEFSDLQWIKSDTGGANATADERIFRMMGGSAMGGIPNHYFGDEANANLATATAMELPLLKMYQARQQWLAGIISDLITFLEETQHEAGNLGDRDDQKKYTDRSLTSERVLQTDSAEVNPMDLKSTPVKEAGNITVHVHGDGSQQGDGKAPPPGAAGAPGDPSKGPLVPTQPPGPVAVPTQPAVFSVLDNKDPGPDAKIDWYVDVDFPPILQKELDKYFNALKTLYDLLPLQNPESAKLVISMALTALGTNDVDKVLDRLFPPLPPGTKPAALTPLAQQGGFPAKLSPIAGLISNASQPGGVGRPDQAGMPAAPAPAQPVRESYAVTPIRVRRIIEAARLAAEVIDGEYSVVTDDAAAG